jgi:hypothetical protein
MNRRAIALLAALALAGAVIAGCGGGDSGGSTGSSNAQDTSSSRTQGFEALQACLEQQGVKLPDRGSGGGPSGSPPSGNPPSGGTPSGGAPSAKARKAFEACRDKLPEGAGPPTGSAGPPSFDQGNNGSTPGVQRQ